MTVVDGCGSNLTTLSEGWGSRVRPLSSDSSTTIGEAGMSDGLSFVKASFPDGTGVGRVISARGSAVKNGSEDVGGVSTIVTVGQRSGAGSDASKVDRGG